MSKQTNKTGSVASMTQRYSIGHKAISVALSVVLLGFGWPTTSLAKAYGIEESTVATEQVEKAADQTTTQGADENAVEGSTETSSAQNSSTQDASEADIALELGNAFIEYQGGQPLAAPATKVTVPASKDFQFSAAAVSGYTLDKVVLTVDGVDSTLTPDADDVYTVPASSVKAGAKITLKTSKDTTSLANSENHAAAEITEGEGAVAGPISDSNDSDIEVASYADELNSVSVASDVAVSTATVTGNDTLEIGKFAVYTANDFSGAVTWSTSDSSVATVDANGVVTAVAKGTVSVIATCGTEVAKKEIEVTKASSALGYKAVITPTIENADVAYFAWHDSSDVSNIAFGKVSGTVTVNDYTTRNKPGYIVFFVKPNSNHIVTGLGASGNGDIYAVDATSWDNINGYPSIAKVMAAAKSAGYVAAFGWSRSSAQTLSADFTIKAQSPDMTVTATSDRTKDVAAGDALTFTVTIAPKTTGSGKDSVTGVHVNSANVNGTTVEVENLTQNSDGSFTGTVHYTATNADCNRGSVVLTVNATSTYGGVYTISSGDISSNATITKTATCTCQIAPASQVQYAFKSGTSDVALPGVINSYLPSDNNKYSANTTVFPVAPEVTEYEDAENNGYWTFAGWDKNSATVSRKGGSITFTGTWTFTKYSKYTVKYVDEDGNEIAESSTVSGNKVGDTVKKDAIEHPEIQGYAYSKTSPDTLTIKDDDSENVIAVVYKKKAGKAGYNLVLDSASWTAPEKTTNTEKMKWYFNYGFAKGDTFTVTNSEPTAADHVFIGWMDKARDGQAAAIRKAGETVTYCYSNNQTYTLDALWASLSATGEDVTYDGKSHTVIVDVKINDGTGLDAKYVEQAKQLITTGDVQYSMDGGKTWSAEKPSFKDAGTYTVQVKQDVTVGGATTTLTAETQVKIAQKEYFVKTNTGSKTYDGSKLVGTATVEGLVSGESATATATTIGPNVTASTTNAVTGEIAWAEGTKSANYKRGTDDLGTLEITKRNVTLTSASGEKAYDGTALTRNEQSDVTVSGDGFASGEGATYSITGSQTSVGSSDNAFTYTLNSNTKSENYNITTETGKLTVKDRSDNEKYEITVEGNSTSVTYDGAEHSAAGITEASKTFTNDKGATFTVAADTTDPKSTDVATKANEVSNVKVTDASGNDVTSQFKATTKDGSLTIAKKSATITAGSAEKEYDGKVLTTDKFTTDGFVGEQGIASATIEGSQTVVGSSSSVVADKSWTAKSGTNLGNYTITARNGTLTVKDRTAKYQIELEGISETKTYSGADQTVSGVKTNTFTFNGETFTVKNYKSDVTGKDAGDYNQTITSTNKDGSWTVADAKGNDVSAQFSVTTKPGKLTIAPKEVTITSGSDSKAYDGAALIKHEASVTAGGFVDGEEAGVSYTYSGSQTDSGSSDNTFEVVFDGTTAKAGNYKVAKVPGALTVNAVADKVTVTITEHGGTYTYDGTQKSAKGYDVSSNNALYTANDFTFSGNASVAGTDAGTYEMQLKAEDFRNTSANFTNVEFVIVDGTLTVSPRKVTLTSGSDYKVYDGTPLTNSEVTVGGDGFASGEGVTYKVTGAIINYGSVENAFTYALNGNTKAGNYTITTTPGTLRVAQVADQVTVTITGTSGLTTYDGNAHSVEGYTVSIDGSELYTNDSVAFNGAAKAGGTDADTYYMGLSADKFSNTNQNFSNVKFVVTDGSLTIGKREVVLKSADLTKAYDGTALANGETALATETGWVEGQGATYTFTGTQTLVGHSVNAFSYTLNEGTKADNYDITKTEGSLTVSSRDAKYEVTVKANSATATYDGKEHEATGVETSEFTVDGQKYTVSGLSTDDPKATDAGTYSNNITGTAVVKDASGNDVTGQFTVKTENGSLAINKATVTLKSASGEWTYDGNEHTKHEMETVSGFAEGEGVDITYTGTITNAGEVSNTYTYELKSNTKASNYNTITPEYGTLKVNPVSDKVTVTITENGDSKAFNGQEQSVEGYTFSTDSSLYGESGFSFVGDASHKVAKGTAVGTYYMGLLASDFKNVSANFSNVEFVIVDGQLEITPVDIDENAVTWSTNDIQHKYDGTEVTAGTATATDKYGKELHVQYSADGGQSWVDSPAEIKATNYSDSKTIQLRARADYNTEGQYAYSDEYLQINQRTLKFTSASATKKFDGTALTRNAQSDVTVSGDGFVAGEGATFTITGSQTAVGSSKNTFTYDFNSDSTKSENYWVIAKTEGDLTVTDNDQAATVTVSGLQKTFVYDGQEHFNYEGTDSTQGWIAEGISPSDSDYANYVATLEANPWTYSGNNAVSRTEVGASNMEMSASQFANTATQFTGVTFDVKQDGWVKIVEQSIDPSDGDSYKGVTVEAPANVVYNGGEQHQKPVVKGANGNVLVEGKDYTLSYSDDVTNAGAVTVTVRGAGNYTGEVETSYQITKRTVNLTSESASKAYDGTALERPTVTGWQQSGNTGFVNGEVSDVKAIGSVANYDDLANTQDNNNTITYNVGASFKADNYTITKDEGTLRITLLSAEKNITINGNNVTYVYDGSAHPAGTATATAVDNNGNAIAAGFHIEYHIKAGVDTEWRSNPAEITWRNAYDSPVTVEIRVWAKNFDGYAYGTETITIAKRDVELTSRGASKVYDGTPLTYDWVDMGPNRVGTGFLWDELAENVAATGSITNVGEVPNTITYKLKENAERNYNILPETVGTLTVTAQSIVPDESNPDSYKGATISSPTDVVYNGVEQKWAPEVKDSKGNALVEGKDYTVSYSEDLTNVGTVTVTIQGIGNFTGTAVKTYKITAAPLTVSTPSATKVYDGTALTAAATAENISGLVNGETATVVANGSQTVEGSSDNGYTIEWGTAASSNYYIQSESIGKLTVTAKSIVPSAETGMAVNDPVSVTYDGQEHKWTPAVTDGEKTLVEGVDYEVSYNNRTDFTNVDGLILVTITGKGNYGGSFGRAYRITPAAVSVVTESASKAYDGSALTANGTMTGLVNGETATFSVTGSQTTTGSSTNWYSIDWIGTAKQSNYRISETLGTLTVTESTNVVVVTTTGYEGVYDGKEHAATVAVSNLPAGYTAEAISSAKATDANGDGIAATADTLIIRNTEGVDVTATLTVQKVDGTIKITPATLNVTTPSVKQAYSGSALTAQGRISGFVDGDYAPFSTTGSQTAVGKSANAYAIDWAAANSTAKASNYNVVESVGELEVTPNTTAIYVIPNGGQKVYDGTALTGNGAWVMGVPAGFTYEVTTKGSQTDKGYGYAEVDTFKILDAAGNDVTSNFNNINAEFKAGLVVTARPVTLTSASAEKVYDGSELTAHSATASQTTKSTGVVAGQAFDLEFFGSQTAEGSSANTFVAKSSSTANVDNYDIAYINGTLTVGKQTIDPGTDPQNPDPSYKGVTVDSPDDSVYDAEENKWEPEVKDAAGNVLTKGTDYTVTYKRGGKVTEDFTNVGAIAVVIAGAGNYTGTVTKTYRITPAAVTLTSNSREFVYNGGSQSDDEVTVTNTPAESEKDTRASSARKLFLDQVEEMKATGSVTNAGDEAVNTITFSMKEGYSADNYTIVKNPGKLTVVAQSIVPGTDENPNPAYNGVEINSPSNVTYDGTAHKWTPTVTGKDGKALVEGTDYTVAYSTDDFTSVGAITVTITGKGNFTGSVERTYQITKRAVTLASESHAFTYNGQAQTWNKFTCDDDLFASQVDNLGCAASVTNVGETATNTVSYAFKAGFSAANYNITERFGKLSVKNSEDEIVVTTTGGTFTYDGKAHGATVSVSDLPAGYKLETATSNATATDVTESDVKASVDTLVIKNAKGEDVTSKLNIKKVDGAIKVTPAVLSVTTLGGEKAYDGEALTADGTISGFVNGDSAPFCTTGSQKYVGESTNGYLISWKDKDATAKQTNYTVEYALGTLKVTDEGVDNNKVINKTHDAGTYALGDTVSFTIKATNIYAEPKTLTISEIDGVTLDQSVFENVQPGATVTAAATYTIQEKDILADTFVNTATVGFSGTNKTFDSTDEVDVDAKNPHLDITKTTISKPANGSTYALGEQIAYDVTVTNSGNLTATDVAVSDQLAGATLAEGQNANVGTLAPGASATVKYVYTVTEADILAGMVNNTATASGNTAGGDPTVTPGSDTEPTDPAAGHVTVAKETTSKPANGTSYALGETIEYRIVAKNDGNLTVAGIEVSDENADGFGTQVVASLAPGASVEFAAKHVVTESDLQAGEVVNVATAKGASPDPDAPDVPVTPGTDTEPTDTAEGHLTVVKTADQTGSAADGAFKLGEVINYTITVTNTGNQTVSNVEVTDPNADGFGVQAIDSLAPKASKTFTASHKVTEADILAGTVVNTATAAGTDPSGKDVDGDGTDTKTIDAVNTTLSVDKTASAPADGKSYKLGEEVTYTIIVTNNGNVTYANVQVVDAQTGLNETIESLAVGESKTFAAKHAITESDIVAGIYANTATAKGDSVTDGDGNKHEVGGSDTETIGGEGADKKIDDGRADLAVSKTVTNKGTGEGGTFQLGDVIEYVITVTNNGNLTAKNFQVVDNNADGFEPVTIASLVPGETTDAIRAKHVVTSDDILAGSYKNVATTAGGSTDDTKVVPNPTPGETDTTVDGVDASLAVDKVAAAPTDGAYKLGDTVTYTVTVTNKGNVPYTNVKVADEQTGLNETIATLAVGESKSFTTTHVIDEADILAGTYKNTATAKADPVKDPKGGQDLTPSGDDTETIGGGDPEKPIEEANPQLVVTKTSDVAAGHLLKEGETVNYTVTVANTGNLTLTNIAVDDQLEGATLAEGESATIESLTPGASKTLRYSYTVKQSDVVAGKVANHATATAGNPSDKGTDVVPGDKVDPTEKAEPSLFVGKTADKTANVSAGDVITYTITATNNGNVDLTGVTVSDELVGFTSEAFDLAKGESRTFTQTYTVTDADMVAGSVRNVATASAKDPSGNVVPGSGETATDTDDVAGALSVVKTAAAGTYAAGDTVEYAITVTNTGNVTVSDIKVADAKTGLEETVTLAKGESKTFSTSYVVTDEDIAAGALTNVATAKGTDPAGKDVEATGTETIGNDPQPDPDSPGEPTLKREFKVVAPSDVVYNGAEQLQKPVVTDGDKVLVEGVDYELSYSEDATNVGAVTVTVTGKGNYTGTREVTYRITPATLIVTTGSATKAYDGTELTEGTLVINGLKGSDKVRGATTGTQTEVGSSTNTYRITWGDVNASNYTIVEELGMLTVTSAAVPTPTPTPTPENPTTPTNPTTPSGTTTPAAPSGTTTPTATTTTPAATPASPVQSIANALENVYEAVTGDTQAAPEEQIYDEENPLGTFSEEPQHCWVHFYLIIGLVLTAIYGAAVVLRRSNHMRKLRNDMNDVLGGGDDGKDPSGSPVASTQPSTMGA